MRTDKLVSEIILKAFRFAKENNHEYITPEHILLVALDKEEFKEAIIKSNGDIEEIKKGLEGYLTEYVIEDSESDPQESFSLQQLFFLANQYAQGSGKKKVSIEHVGAAFYSLEESYAKFYLESNSVGKRDLLYNLVHEKGLHEDVEEVEATIDEKEPKKDPIEAYSQNLNKYVVENNVDPLIGREDILTRTIQILCRRNKNNPIHVGEPGVGKTALTFGLAKLITEGNVPQKLKDAEVFSLDIGSMLAGTKYRGDFEERIKKVLDSLKEHKKPIVYIDEIHNIVGAGALNGGALDASNLLKPYLMEGKIKFIGATTFDEYKKHFEKDKALSRRFQTIDIKEPSVNEAIDILMGLKDNFEEFHNVKYTDKAIETAVNLSSKYINGKFLPDKAIDVIDEAGSFHSMNSTEEIVIDEKEIEEVISKICNIPKQTVETNEVENLKNLESDLKRNIFGQNQAVENVVRCIKMSRAGLNDDNKPVASMLFVGPTGVGKTEIAKTLAKTLGVELVRFDMSEYGEKHSASKLIGSPPGYVGYEEGGLLTDTIRKKPHCVLLLDEIEKAHADILNVLLQVMDYATLSDNKGRKADFRNVVLIMTSNAGAKNIGKPLVGFGDREIKGEAIMEEVKKFFTPEFRNRLDKVVVFNHLNDEMAFSIAKKELSKFKDRLITKNIEVSFTDSCISYVANKGVSKEYGAREILRIINEKIKPILVDEILFGKLASGSKGTVDYNKEKDGFFLV